MYGVVGVVTWCLCPNKWDQWKSKKSFKSKSQKDRLSRCYFMSVSLLVWSCSFFCLFVMSSRVVLWNHMFCIVVVLLCSLVSQTRVWLIHMFCIVVVLFYIYVFIQIGHFIDSHSLIKQVSSSLLFTIIAQVLFNHKTISILLTKSSNKIPSFLFFMFLF